MSESSGIGTATAAARATKSSEGVGRNFVAMLVWQIGNLLVPLATFPYLTRVLGPSQFGVLSYVIAITVYGTIFTEWGFNLSGPQAVIKCRNDPVALNELIWSTIGAKACLCFISFGILLVVLRFDRQAGVAMSTVLLSWLIVIGNVITLSWLLQGLERFSLFATVSIAGRLVTVPLTFLFVRNSSDVAAAVVIQAAAPILTGFVSLEVARRLGLLRRPHVSWHSMWQRVVQGADMFVATASVTLFSATNAIILGSMAGTYQVGIYAAADRLKMAGNIVPAQINTVLYPRVSALFLDNRRSAARLAFLGVIATIATTGAGVLVAVLYGGPLTRLVLGNQYQGSGSVLTLLCIATLFGNLAYLLGLQVLVPFGGTRKRSRVMLAAGVTNIVLAVLLVPKFGADGAAIAFLIAEAAILVVYLFMIVRTPPLRAHFTQLLDR
jgi:O-antigen/teichoic acid export membrane protein